MPKCSIFSTKVTIWHAQYSPSVWTSLPPWPMRLWSKSSLIAPNLRLCSTRVAAKKPAVGPTVRRDHVIVSMWMVGWDSQLVIENISEQYKDSDQTLSG